MNTKKLTKIVFYIMAVLLAITTVLSVYMAFTINSLNSKLSDSDTVGSDSSYVSGQLTIPDGYTLISDDSLSKQKDESYYLGRDNLLSSLKAMMETGTTTLQMLRALYPEYLIYSDDGGYVFKGIDYTLATHTYDASGFKITEGDYSIPSDVEYYEDDVLVSTKGIDVSKHNGTIDWKAVKTAGIDFAMIRAANRGYGTEGNLNADDKFAENAEAALENNIDIGAYIFSEAITVEEAIEEAELVLSVIEPFDIKYPVVIDIEDISNDTGRNEALTPSELTDVVLAFCNRIKEAGYTPMIYCNLKGFLGMLEFDRLEGIEKWYAYYGDELYFPYDVSMWQYSASGTIPGVDGKVDLNISFKDYSK